MNLMWMPIVGLFVGLLGTAHGGGDSRGRGGPIGGDYSGSSEDGGYYGTGVISESCTCVNIGRKPTCRYNVGILNMGCRNSNNFVQCVDQTCSLQTCPPNQVWNRTLGVCAPCTPGSHLTSDLKRCSCDVGTTRYEKNPNTCVACPSGSVGWTTEYDYCQCPLTQVLDTNTNVCRSCPADTYLNRGRCSCLNSALFWSSTAWGCQDCPGTWVTIPSSKPSKQPPRPVCRCSGPNQIFNRRTVSCLTCPTGSLARIQPRGDDEDTCQCPLVYQRFDDVTGQCVCAKGSTLNAAGTACEWIPVAAVTTSFTTQSRIINP